MTTVMLDLPTTFLKEYSFQIVISIVFISAVSLTIFISLAIYKWNTRHISKLAEAMRVIGAGDFGHKIALNTKGMIVTLVREINDMSENIDNKFKKLQTISYNLFSSIELNAALKTSLDAILELTGGTVGLIMLVNDDETRLDFAMAEGIKPKIVGDDIFIRHGRFAVQLSNDFREWIKNPANNRIFSVEDLNNIPAATHIMEWLNAAGCDFFAPLLLKDQLKGFFLYSCELRGSVNFLNTLFYQITMAIENARLYHLAVTDGLTGLYNHGYFQMRLKQEFQRVHRYGTQFSLMMFDIDHFKKFNDTHGHQIGDMILREVAKILKYQSREVDIASRYGGEEMAVILPETDINGAAKLAERIRLIVERYRFSHNLKITVSIGLSYCNSKAPADKETLIKHADIALYRAKAEGRNRVCAASNE